MDKKKANMLFFIASICLTVAGIIFLLVAMFGVNKSNWVLASALFCILLSNLFNIVRIRLNKKGQ